MCVCVALLLVCIALLATALISACSFLCLCVCVALLLVGIALLATALIINWELGLVMMACVPFIGASVAILSKLMSTSTQEGADFYSKAGGVATEVTVVAYYLAYRGSFVLFLPRTG